MLIPEDDLLASLQLVLSTTLLPPGPGALGISIQAHGEVFKLRPVGRSQCLGHVCLFVGLESPGLIVVLVHAWAQVQGTIHL